MTQAFLPLDTTLPLPSLPLVLWKTPPALEMILAQEGVPTIKWDGGQDRPLLAGRFVLFDPTQVRTSELTHGLSPLHVPINIDRLVRGLPGRPWEALLDTSAAPMAWTVAGRTLVENVAREPKGPLRRKILGRLRNAVSKAGGLWVRLASYPAPYRSAFNLRVDLDEHVPTDYFRFAEARKPIRDCTSHYVSTRAYGDSMAVLDDLRELDTQSHGHYHFIYRDRESNARNLLRADRILRDRGFAPTGFAAPHGRWNRGLDAVLESLSYRYSTDFQLGYDDLPFHPWVGDRFSRVLQIPIHPVCEGLFLDAGLGLGGLIGLYFGEVVRKKLSKGEPAFVYGHPERRLGRYPEILREIVNAVDEFPLAWRVTLTEFARWWTWRTERTWSLVEKGEGRFEVICENWDNSFPMAIEVLRGQHLARVALTSPRMTFRVQDFAYEQFSDSPAVEPPATALIKRDFRSMVRAAIDWETETPVEELASGSILRFIKRELRRHQDRVA